MELGEVTSKPRDLGNDRGYRVAVSDRGCADMGRSPSRLRVFDGLHPYKCCEGVRLVVAEGG